MSERPRPLRHVQGEVDERDRQRALEAHLRLGGGLTLRVRGPTGSRFVVCEPMGVLVGRLVRRELPHTRGQLQRFRRLGASPETRYQWRFRVSVTFVNFAGLKHLSILGRGTIRVDQAEVLGAVQTNLWNAFKRSGWPVPPPMKAGF